ncbi:MAG: hypothetical protein H7210_09850 [Pyrinomonadaceae bacterium]|nr:hypothetical protein [Phycisphaerales bacterium]
MISPSSSVSAPQTMTLAEAANRRSDLLRQRRNILDGQNERRNRAIELFAEARGCLPEPLRDYLLPIGADGFPADECLFRRADMNKATEVERDARFRYRLAHEALEWQRGLAEAVRLLPPDRDERLTDQDDIELEILIDLKDEIEEMERLCVCQPAAADASAVQSGAYVPASTVSLSKDEDFFPC